MVKSLSRLYYPFFFWLFKLLTIYTSYGPNWRRRCLAKPLSNMKMNTRECRKQRPHLAWFGTSNRWSVLFTKFVLQVKKWCPLLYKTVRILFPKSQICQFATRHKHLLAQWLISPTTALLALARLKSSRLRYSSLSKLSNSGCFAKGSLLSRAPR